ncbi:MAG: hypothetical protein RDV00_01110 [Clostridia bacterium]|nr:hypothetical protein [Clostridia bacterium]
MPRREERARLAFQHRQIEQIRRNVENVVRASQITNDPRTPDGVRAYANQVLQQALDEQSRINEKLGIGRRQIDTHGVMGSNKSVDRIAITLRFVATGYTAVKNLCGLIP